MGGDLETHACTVPCQIQNREDHGDPEDYVLVNEAVEILVEEEEDGPYKGCVWEVQLTLGHVCYHQLVGDLGDNQAKCEQVQTGVMLKQMGG